MNTRFLKAISLFLILSILLSACTLSFVPNQQGGFDLVINPSGTQAAPAAATEPAATEPPTREPIATEPPAATEEPATSVDFEIEPEKTETVPAGTRLSGDVVACGEQLYDNDKWTGVLVDMQTDCEVYAEWGASVNETSIDDWVDLMLQTGCHEGQGCHKVAVWVCTDSGCELKEWRE